jgi:hypothetical protein
LVFTIFAALWGYYPGDNNKGRLFYKIFLIYSRLFLKHFSNFADRMANLTIRHKNGEQRLSLIVIFEKDDLNLRTDT